MLQAARTHITCPVAPLASEAVEMIKAIWRYDLKNPRLFDAAHDRLAHLARAASEMTAASLEGLLFQTLICHSELDVVTSWISDEAILSASPSLEAVNSLLLNMVRTLRGGAMEPLLRYYMTDLLQLDAIAA